MKKFYEILFTDLLPEPLSDDKKFKYIAQIIRNQIDVLRNTYLNKLDYYNFEDYIELHEDICDYIAYTRFIATYEYTQFYNFYNDHLRRTTKNDLIVQNPVNIFKGIGLNFNLLNFYLFEKLAIPKVRTDRQFYWTYEPNRTTITDMPINHFTIRPQYLDEYIADLPTQEWFNNIIVPIIRKLKPLSMRFDKFTDITPIEINDELIEDTNLIIKIHCLTTHIIKISDTPIPEEVIVQ